MNRHQPPQWSKNWINVYEVDRCYGGPEEGGWYWNAYTCLQSIPVDLLEESEAEKMRALLEKQYPESDIDLGSVLSDGTFYVIREKEKAESETKEIPHYE